MIGLVFLFLFQGCYGSHYSDPEPCTSENTTTVIISEVSCVNLHELSNNTYSIWIRPQLSDGRPLVLSNECVCSGCPYYLNDTLPTNGTDLVRTRSPCAIIIETFSLYVRKCDGFFVFYMESDFKFMKLFFGLMFEECWAPYRGPCQKSSNTTDSDLHVCPEVGSFHEETEDGSAMEAVFKCLFQPVPGNVEYDVEWFIDGTLVNNATFSGVSYSNINDTALRPRHWTNNFTMSFQVTCAVKSRDAISGNRGEFHESPSYFAGIKSDHQQYSVVEGETIQIGFQATVPFSCPSVLSDAMKASHCSFQFYIWTPGEGQCVNGQTSNGVAFKNNPCGILFGYKDKRKSINVTGFIDGLVNFGERKSILKVASTQNPMDSSGIWNGVKIPDITVIVKDKDVLVSGKYCASYTDPHQRTFDGRYFSNQRAGEFLLYRHKTLPYTFCREENTTQLYDKRDEFSFSIANFSYLCSNIPLPTYGVYVSQFDTQWLVLLMVHVLFSACVWGRATCNCGIAIRSGGSLFSVRTCAVVSTTWTKTLSVPEEKNDICNEDDMRIKKYWRYYMVTLPSGTVVSFSVSWWGNWVGSIRIRASVSDIRNTEGLCGLVNDDVTDDFILQSGQHTTDPNSFAESWRIPMNSLDKSLFVKNPKILSESFSYTPESNTDNENYCTCPSDEPVNPYSPDFDSRNHAHCNQTTPSSACGSQVSMVTDISSCRTSNRRRKRSVDSDDIGDATTLTYATDFDETAVFNVSDWINGWNATSARKYCEDAFTFDPAVETCNELVNISAEAYIDSCVEDIKMSGNTTWVEDTLDTLKGACLTEAQKQEVFYSNSTSNSSEGLSIIQLITSQLCPANCSGNGECKEATCSCNDGFIGSDCSARESTPPTEFSLPSSGVCDTRQRLCRQTNIAGKFYSENVIANFTYFNVGETESSNTFSAMQNATFRHFNLITVTLPDIPVSSRRRRRSVVDGVHGWNITLSYDGKTFSDHVTLLVYDTIPFNVIHMRASGEKMHRFDAILAPIHVRVYLPVTEIDERDPIVYDSQRYSCDTQTLVCQKLISESDSPSSTSDPAVPLPVIAGVVGGVLIILVVIGVLLVLIKKKRIPEGRAQSVIGIQKDDEKSVKDTGSKFAGDNDYGPVIPSLPPMKNVYQQKRAGTDISLHFDNKY